MRLHERIEVAQDMRAGVGGLLGVVLVVDALVGATAATGGEIEAATAGGILQRIASGQIVEQHRQQQPKPVATMADGGGLNGGGKRQATRQRYPKVNITLIINILIANISRLACKCLVDNTLTQQTSSPHPNCPNIRDRFQEKHEKNFFPA